MATESDGQTPRAVIHKRILEVASDQPDASLEALAEEIPGASADLVERVLDEYGDPSEEPKVSPEPEPEVDDPESPTSESTSDAVSLPNREDLSAKQRETLRQIDEAPTATQREIGEALGVSAATISNRLSDIVEFSWQDRQEFASRLFGTPLIGDGHGQMERDAQSEVEPRLEQLEAKLSALESDVNGSNVPPELAHKVLHTCMNSEEFTKEEELELIRALFGESPPS